MPNVRVNGSGKLFFNFYYRKIRCREYTLLNDTAANRRLMEQKYKQIEKEISAGTFSYQGEFALPRT
jgi:integrase